MKMNNLNPNKMKKNTIVNINLELVGEKKYKIILFVFKILFGNQNVIDMGGGRIEINE